VEKSYPVYDSTYTTHLKTIREYIDSLENFQTIGRNGLHRYNNQDHAMLTGMFAVRNMINGDKIDLWSVNAEQEYHEEIRETKLPAREVEVAIENALARAFMKLDPRAFGASLGMVLGVLLSSFTLIVFQNRLFGVIDKLWLLEQYFPGYSVSIGGSFLGLIYKILVGFVIGWSFAVLRNTSVLIYMAIIHRRAEMQFLRKILDF
jgi:hypothetical protein